MKAAFVVSRCGRELCSLLSDIEVKNIGSAALQTARRWRKIVAFRLCTMDKGVMQDGDTNLRRSGFEVTAGAYLNSCKPF